MTFHSAQLTFLRSFGTTPDRLWHLLTDPKMREIWSGPSDDLTLVVDQADLSEGGQDTHRCGPVDAPDFTVDTRWYRLCAPDAACFTETVRAGGETFSTTLVTYGLSKTATGVDLKIDMMVASYAGPEAIGEHEEGWTSALNRLAGLAKREPA